MAYTVKLNTATRMANKLIPGRFNKPMANNCLFSKCACTIEDVEEIEIEFYTVVCRTDNSTEIQTKVDAAADAAAASYN